MLVLGKHIISELSLCDNEKLKDLKFIEKILVKAVEVANCTLLKKAFYKFGENGISGVVILSESHISIHTWPEYNYAAIDIYTCGNDAHPERAYEYIKEQLESQYVKVSIMDRGDVQDEKKDLELFIDAPSQ